MKPALRTIRIVHLHHKSRAIGGAADAVGLSILLHNGGDLGLPLRQIELPSNLLLLEVAIETAIRHISIRIAFVEAKACLPTDFLFLPRLSDIFLLNSQSLPIQRNFSIDL